MNVASSIKYSNHYPLATVVLKNINSNDNIESFTLTLRGALYTVCQFPPFMRTKSGIIKVVTLIEYNPLAEMKQIDAKMNFSAKEIDNFVNQMKKTLQEYIEKKPEPKLILLPKNDA